MYTIKERVFIVSAGAHLAFLPSRNTVAFLQEDDRHMYLNV